MKATNTAYDFKASLTRIDEILDAGTGNYSDQKSMPSRDALTYKNGFYVNCTAIFVDICGSSDMTDSQRRPVLVKIYRSFISEMVAMFNGFGQCREISINGDCVWAVFDTPSNADVDVAFDAACKAGSLVDVLNFKLGRKGYTTYQANIGMDYGRALMIQAGYKGSAINDVIWMGGVVNSACHLCNEERRILRNRILLGQEVYSRLKNSYQDLCERYDYVRGIYGSNAVSIELNGWLKEQKSRG